MTSMITSSKRIATRCVGMAVLVAVGACTSEGGAEPSFESPSIETSASTPAPTTEATTLGTTSAGASSVAAGELPPSAPTDILATYRGGAGWLDRVTGSFDQRFTTAPLTIGQPPSESEMVTSAADAGRGDLLVGREEADGGAAIVIVTPEGSAEFAFDGTHVSTAGDLRRVAFAPGDTTVVVGDVETRRTGAAAVVPGEVVSIVWNREGTELAVGWTADGSAGVTIAELEGLDIVAVSELIRPRGVAWHHPTWLGGATMAVVEQALVPDDDSATGLRLTGNARLIVTDLETRVQETSSVLGHGVVSMDASPDGSTLLIVSTEGELSWWSDGAGGPIDPGPWRTASW